MPLLPFDEVRQHFACRLAVADEIVVDEIDDTRRVRLRDHCVEFADDLLGRFQARLAAVKRRDVAEFAAIGTAAGELDRREQIPLQQHLVIRWQRKIGERQALFCLEAHLLRGWLDARIKQRDQVIRRVAEFADMQVVECGIHVRRAGHRGAAEHGDLAGRLGARVDRVDLRRLHMHAADKHDISPGEIGGFGRRDILVDEPNVPHRWEIGGNDQKALRRHEGAHVAHQRISVLERRERRRVGRKDAEHAARIFYGKQTVHLVPRRHLPHQRSRHSG